LTAFQARPSIVAAVALAAAVTRSTPAAAQACCAGAGAVTPGRLAVHEDALVGLQVRLADTFGSFRGDGVYVRANATEQDAEQDLFGAWRVAPHAQLALLVPFVQTYRRAEGATDTGGGLGDVNLSGRYDFVLAGESGFIPGAAVLAGITLPTGRSIESSDAVDHPLASDATGIGAYQVNVGLALEQTSGPWLVGLSGLYSKPTARTVFGMKVSLASQWTALAAIAYTFSNDAALALVASYAVQGNTVADGVERAGTARRIPQFTLSGLYPLTDAWRVQGGLFVTPPFSQFGRNTPSNLGFVFTLMRTWS
jgi:hypothetical protein